MGMVLFDEVKDCMAWNGMDQAHIFQLRDWLDADIDGMIEGFGEQLAQAKGKQSLMTNARFVRRLHDMLHEWLAGLLNGAFDEEYAEERRSFGEQLVGLDLNFGDIILLASMARKEFSEIALERLEEQPDLFASIMQALDKALNLDLTLVYDGYLHVHDAEMERKLLDRFLTITGFSRTLYENLAEAHEWNEERKMLA
jgi:hypothetical protein